MMMWSQTEIMVFYVLLAMLGYKLWTVWHVARKSKANREGKLIFIGVISGLSLFAAGAKLYIGHMMGL